MSVTPSSQQFLSSQALFCKHFSYNKDTLSKYVVINESINEESVFVSLW